MAHTEYIGMVSYGLNRRDPRCERGCLTGSLSQQCGCEPAFVRIHLNMNMFGFIFACAVGGPGLQRQCWATSTQTVGE